MENIDIQGINCLKINAIITLQMLGPWIFREKLFLNLVFNLCDFKISYAFVSNLAIHK